MSPSRARRCPACRAAHAAPGSARCGTRRNRVRRPAPAPRGAWRSASSGRRSQRQVLALQRRRDRAVEDAVAVAAGACGEACMEIAVDRRHHSTRTDAGSGWLRRAPSRAARARRRCRNAPPGRRHARRHRCALRRPTSTDVRRRTTVPPRRRPARSARRGDRSPGCSAAASRRNRCRRIRRPARSAQPASARPRLKLSNWELRSS